MTRIKTPKIVYVDPSPQIKILDMTIKRRFWFDKTLDYAELQEEASRIIQYPDGRIFREVLEPGFRGIGG